MVSQKAGYFGQCFSFPRRRRRTCSERCGRAWRYQRHVRFPSTAPGSQSDFQCFLFSQPEFLNFGHRWGRTRQWHAAHCCSCSGVKETRLAYPPKNNHGSQHRRGAGFCFCLPFFFEEVSLEERSPDSGGVGSTCLEVGKACWLSFQMLKRCCCWASSSFWSREKL